jgi:hypothetical protein
MATHRIFAVACLAAAAAYGQTANAAFILGTLSSDVDAYNSWAANCPASLGANAPTPYAGGLCTQASSPTANGTTLFSWGNLDNAANSVRTLTYSGTQSILLDAITGIQFTSVTDTAVGTAGVKYSISTGNGANVTWEWGGITGPDNGGVDTFASLIGEAKMRITIGGMTQEFMVFPPYVGSNGSATWWDNLVTQTPLDGVGYGFGATKMVVHPGDQIQFRFYESFWDGNPDAVAKAGGTAAYPNGIPDVVYSSINVVLNGETINDAPAPATLALLGLGLFSLSRTRRGTA